MAEKEIIDYITENEILELANADIYRKNPFQVFGLSVSATSRDFKKKAQLFNHRQSIDDPITPAEWGSIFSFTLSGEMINQAILDIQAPRKRSAYEFFWIWEEGDSQEPTNNSVSRLQAYKEYWRKHYWMAKALDEQGQNAAISLHNLTILLHATVLEDELSLLEGNNGHKTRERIDLLWIKVYEYFNELLSNALFVQIWKNQIKNKNDPALSEAYAHSIIRSVPLVLFCIHADLIDRFINKELYEDVKRQQDLISLLRVTNTQKRTLLKEKIETYYERVKSVCTETAQQANQNPRKFSDYFRDLVDRTKKERTFIDALLNHSAISINISDEIFRVAFEGLDLFFKETEDIEQCRKILLDLSPIAQSNQQRDQIKEAQEFLDLKSREGNFWHAPGYFQLPHDVLQVLENAKSEFQKQRIEQAITILTSYIKTAEYISPESQICLKTALARCYVQKGYIELEAFSKCRNEIVDRIIQREASGVFLYSSCASCGMPAFGKYFIVIDRKEYRVCQNCYYQAELTDKTFHDKRKKHIINARDSFYTAYQLNPKNQLALKQQKQLENDAPELLGINLPHPNSLYQFPSVPSQPQKSSQPQQPLQPQQPSQPQQPLQAQQLSQPQQPFQPQNKEESRTSPIRETTKTETNHSSLPVERQKLGQSLLKTLAMSKLETASLVMTFSIILILVLFAMFVVLFEPTISFPSQPNFEPTLNNSFLPTKSSPARVEATQTSTRPPTATPVPREPISYKQAISPTFFNLGDFARRGDYVYLASQSGDLHVFRIENETIAQEVASLRLAQSLSQVVIQGDLAFLPAGKEGLFILDVQLPESPRQVAHYSGTTQALSVFPEGQLLYLANGEAGVQILDISTPANPSLLHSYNLEGSGIVNDLVKIDHYLYLANGWAGLLILDISDLRNPIPRGKHFSFGESKAIDSDGRYIYLAEGFGGLTILEVQDRKTPQLIMNIPSSTLSPSFGEASDLALISPILLVADNLNNFTILDVSKPLNPSIALDDQTFIQLSPVSCASGGVCEKVSQVNPTTTPLSRAVTSGCTWVYLNVRKSPDLGAMVLDVIEADKCFEILGRNIEATWLYVRFTKNGKTTLGWVSIDFVRLDGNVNLLDIPIHLTP